MILGLSEGSKEADKLSAGARVLEYRQEPSEADATTVGQHSKQEAPSVRWGFVLERMDVYFEDTKRISERRYGIP